MNLDDLLEEFKDDKGGAAQMNAWGPDNEVRAQKAGHVGNTQGAEDSWGTFSSPQPKPVVQQAKQLQLNPTGWEDADERFSPITATYSDPAKPSSKKSAVGAAIKSVKRDEEDIDDLLKDITGANTPSAVHPQQYVY